MIKPVNELLSDAVYYRNYHLIKKLARYKDYVCKELNQMSKKLPSG